MGLDSRGHGVHGATWMGIPLKPLSLVLLTCQNTLLILLLHHSRVMPAPGGHKYITSTAVFMTEVLKFSVCFTASLYDITKTMPPSFPATALFSEVANSIFAGDSWKLAIPASLYVAQNSLQYIAISNLDSATFLVVYQFKVIPTAILSVILLKRTLHPRQWMALGLLMFGVAVVQFPVGDTHLYSFKMNRFHWHVPHLPRNFDDIRHAGALTGHGLHKRSATYEGIAEDEGLLEQPTTSAAIGFIAAICGCTVASFASVYFEKLLKETTTPTSLWVRNVQLAFYSFFPSLFIGVMFVDGEKIAKQGFFVGYNMIVWLSIIVQVWGGVLVSLCIMYADNISKSFAMSFSILLSLLASVWFFHFKVTTHFLVGTALVLTATYLYNSASGTERRLSQMRLHEYEKVTIEKSRERQNGAPRKLPTTPLKSSLARSSSRPTSPTGLHHFRAGSSRDYFGSKDRDD